MRMKDKLVKKLLIGREDWSGHTFCHLVECKGLGDHHIVDKVLRSLQTTGRTRINSKTDGEPAIVQLQERIISQREQDTIAVNPPMTLNLMDWLKRQSRM